ncbi:MAG TPA: class I SAM-dependent methyltransferase [Vicinamibacterales bacterium]|nr:class I SAM-dependent methyltransferase [Vicinamibacterales bacterium]
MDRLLELTHLAEQSHFWFRGFRWFVQPEVAQAVEGRRSPVLLDCGCGTGSNVAWLANYGDAYGFDLTWNGLALGHQMGRRRLARASIAAIPFATGSVDVATSFDVFQCLPDPIELDAIRELWRVLKPGGHLILNVAALDVLRGQHATLSEEVRRYTPERLRQIVETGGFIIDRLTFLNASLLPVMLPVRVAQRWRSGATVPAGEFDITVPAAPVNALLSALLRVEAAALRLVDMPIGSSLLCHARKAA